MSEYYQTLDTPYFDYALTRFPGVESLELRGPLPDFDRPFIACIGAAQTFGRFCHAPFPTLLQHALGIQALNLGIGGAGPRAFTEPALIHALNRSSLVVVQVLSARSASNSQFDNTGHGHGVIGRRSRDGQIMRFDEFLQDLLDAEEPRTINRVIAETRESYLEGFTSLLAQLRPPKILHWFSTRPPDLADDFENARAAGVWPVLGAYPQLVNRPMLERLRCLCEGYVETVSTAGLPQPLWPAMEAVVGTELREGRLFNAYYPSQAMHAEAARDLEPLCRGLTLGAPPIQTEAGESRSGGASAPRG